jgi:hypothetical protein
MRRSNATMLVLLGALAALPAAFQDARPAASSGDQPAAAKEFSGRQTRSGTVASTAAIRQAALDYIEGWYEGNADRVARVLHPQFVRRIAAVTVAGDDFFLHDDREKFLAGVRAGGDRAVPPDVRAIRLSVLDAARTLASVRVDSAYYVEYLSLVRMRERWLVVNVLRENVANDRTAIALDPRVLAPYAGQYRSETGEVMGILVDGARIFLLPAGGPRIEFFPESAPAFFTKGYKSGLTFVRDGSGTVVRMIHHVRYRDEALEKIR